jgi:hypothetical protein
MTSTFIKKTLAPEIEKGAVWLARPFQLVSLLDMFKFFGDKFYHLAQAAELIRITALELVEEGNAQIPKDLRENFRRDLVKLWNGYEEIGLPFSATQIKRILVCLTGLESKPNAAMDDPEVEWMTLRSQQGEHYTSQNLATDMEALHLRIMDEVATTFLIQIPPNKANYFNQSMLFGQQVADNFPATVLDVEEAGKCFAVGRNTACVMHLMRVVEVGLRAYGSGLGVLANITAAQPDWGTVLRVANDEIRRLNASGDPTWTQDKRAFFETAHAHFHAVRIAWRNPSMHVDKTYDETRAEDILNAVKGWMRHMAEHLDESGQFTP